MFSLMSVDFRVVFCLCFRLLFMMCFGEAILENAPMNYLAIGTRLSVKYSYSPMSVLGCCCLAGKRLHINFCADDYLFIKSLLVFLI